MGNLLSLAKRLRTVAFGGCSGAAVDLCGCDGGQVFRFGKLIIEGGHFQFGYCAATPLANYCSC